MSRKKCCRWDEKDEIWLRCWLWSAEVAFLAIFTDWFIAFSFQMQFVGRLKGELPGLDEDLSEDEASEEEKYDILFLVHLNL